MKAHFATAVVDFGIQPDGFWNMTVRQYFAVLNRWLETKGVKKKASYNEAIAAAEEGERILAKVKNNE